MLLDVQVPTRPSSWTTTAAGVLVVVAGGVAGGVESVRVRRLSCAALASVHDPAQGTVLVLLLTSTQHRPRYPQTGQDALAAPRAEQCALPPITLNTQNAPLCSGRCSHL